MKKIVFVTGTRADFGKIKSLLHSMEKSKGFEAHVFVSGMHLLKKYGFTVEEIEKSGFQNIYRCPNQQEGDPLEKILANTATGLGKYLRDLRPDLVVVHGDRVEALAGALAGAFNNILVAHIEGGELSGSIDEHIRHAITKISHVHFVANNQAKKRLLQMGEKEGNIHVIGSPDFDIMNSKLPPLDEVKRWYKIGFDNYALLLFHPVTTELKKFRKQAQILVDSLIRSKFNFLVVYPNNDPGTDIIQQIYKCKLARNKRFRIFPSIRFEFFLSLLKDAHFIIGNSSAGIREAPYYGVPCINVGDRQKNRISAEAGDCIFNCGYKGDEILNLIYRFSGKKRGSSP